MWLVWMVPALQREDSATEFLRRPSTGVQHLCSGRDCPLQAGQNDSGLGKTRNQGYFMLVAGKGDSSIWSCPGFHLSVLYCANNKVTLAKNLKMEEVFSDKRSVFVGHGYIQHGGAMEGDYSFRYHTYLIPEDADLKDAIALAYGDSLRRMSKKRKQLNRFT